MQWRNTATHFGVLAKFFHWTTAAAFIAAYIVVYYVIWFMDDTSQGSWPVLNIHWVLGLLVGFLVLPILLDVKGIWLAVPLAEVLTLLLIGSLYLHEKQKQKS